VPPKVAPTHSLSPPTYLRSSSHGVSPISSIYWSPPGDSGAFDLLPVTLRINLSAPHHRPPPYISTDPTSEPPTSAPPGGKNLCAPAARRPPYISTASRRPPGLRPPPPRPPQDTRSSIARPPHRASRKGHPTWIPPGRMPLRPSLLTSRLPAFQPHPVRLAWHHLVRQGEDHAADCHRRHRLARRDRP